MRSLYSFLLFFSFFITDSYSQRGVNGVNYDYNCRCLGIEKDGTITVESYGKGRNKSDASEQAQKNAVWEVLFNGIKDGNGGCNSDPLLFSSNAKLYHETFFNEFFKDKGKYKTFVSLEDEKTRNKISRNVKKGKEVEQRMVVVRVDRPRLKTYLLENNIK